MSASIPINSPSNTNYILLGRLQAAWLTLDYILRFALIRARGLSFNTAPSERIFAISDASTIVEKLLSHYTPATNAELHNLCHEITLIPDGIYKRYKTASFTLWAHDPDSGQLTFHRIGHQNWRKPFTQTTAQIETLIQDIHNSADRIEMLTRPQS